MEEQEISLRELIEIILKGKYFIITITIIALLASGILSFFILDPVYEAKTVIVVNQPTLPKIQGQGLETLVDTLSKMPSINAQTYASQVKTAVVLRNVIEKVGLDLKEYPISIFSKKISVSNIKGTDLLEITVEDKDPKLAANIANTLAQEFVHFVSTTNQDRMSKALAFLETQVKGEQAKLYENVEKMKEFLKQPNGVAEIEQEISTKLTLLSQLKGELVKMDIEKVSLQEGIEAGEKILANIPMRVELKKNLFDNPALYQTLAENRGMTVSSVANLELKSEEINPVYFEIKQDIENNKKYLAQILAKKNATEKQVSTISSELEQLQVELADKKTKYEQLQEEIEKSKQNYDLFSKKYTEAQIAESAKIGEATLLVVSPAHEPQIPVGPRKVLNLAIAAVFGLMIGTFVVVFRNYWVNSNPGQVNA